MVRLGREETHVLMVTLPLQGHINPMLKFAKRLLPKGLHVTIATTEPARHRLLAATTAATATQSPNLPEPVHPSLAIEFFSDGLDDQTRTDETMLESLRNVGPKNLYEIIRNLEIKKKISCIVSSPFTPWVPDVAFDHNIPCSVLWIQACGVFSVYYRHYTNANAFPDLSDPMQTLELPALPLLEVRDLPSFILPSSGHFRILMAEFVESLNKVKWVLANSFYELEPEIIESMASLKPIIPIGPLVSPFLVEENERTLEGNNLDMWRSEDSCIEWLDKQPPSSVVYISFGSLIETSENQIASITKALKKLEKRFLWVVRPVARVESVCELRELVEEGRGMVVEWGPQEKVLSHMAVDCFITHCGWNSVLETVATGIPVVAYPEWTDQPMDARLLVEVFKIGVRMRDDDVTGELSATEVERCLVEITEGPAAEDMRRRVAELKNAARKAVARDGSSSRNLDRFISEITGN